MWLAWWWATKNKLHFRTTISLTTESETETNRQTECLLSSNVIHVRRFKHKLISKPKVLYTLGGDLIATVPKQFGSLLCLCNPYLPSLLSKFSFSFSPQLFSHTGTLITIISTFSLISTLIFKSGTTCIKIISQVSIYVLDAVLLKKI